MKLYYSRRSRCRVSQSDVALELQDLRVRYPRTQQDAVRGVSLAIPSGTKTALIGHNGSGKSTLMKAAGGILPYQHGSVRIYGLPIGSCHQVAYLPQRGEIDWRFPVTVERLVLAGRYVHLGWLRRPGRRDYELTRLAMERMRISHLAERQIGMLSGGQQQRALLARALAQDAALLLLDEPLTGVDQKSRGIFAGVLDELVTEGRTVIMATHDTSEGHCSDSDDNHAGQSDPTGDWDRIIELVEGRLHELAY